MLDEQQAIEAARRLFVTRLAESAVREVTALTVDGGQSWVVHFHKRLPPNRVESPGSWAICVCGETGGCNWVEMM